jgi:hypothetical protein
MLYQVIFFTREQSVVGERLPDLDTINVLVHAAVHRNLL